MSKIFRNVRMILNGCPVCKKNATFKTMVGNDETYKNFPLIYHISLNTLVMTNAKFGHPENYLCGASGECECTYSFFGKIWLVGPTGDKIIPYQKSKNFPSVRKKLKAEFQKLWIKERDYL